MSALIIPSIQELFDRAWNGLAAQKWRKATTGRGLTCVYLAANGDRCAWGHADPEGTAGQIAGVGSLRVDGVGIAGHLDDRGFHFATMLQRAHDACQIDESMADRLRAVAKAFDLTVPDDRQEATSP